MTSQSFLDSLRSGVGAFAQKMYPNLDERAYRRSRGHERNARLGAYPQSLALPRISGPISAPHVVVVPYEGDAFGEWGPAKGNFYFEVAENLRDLIGTDKVSVFQVEPGTPFHKWHIDLINFLNDVGATHLITHIEADPATRGQEWTWDSALDLMKKHWGGVLLGVMFDSAYRYINFKSRILGKRSANFMVVDICMPMNDSMVKGRTEVGPVNRPMSNATLELLAKRASEVPKNFDVSFIGVLYPYRIELIEQLRGLGFAIAVNPHRPEAELTGASSRANQPSWLDYMTGLAGSKATINFSQSSAGPFEQLKWRVIEAGLAGTFLLTDDKDRTRLFWDQRDYARFDGIGDLPQIMQSWLSQPAELALASERFHERAVHLARTDFWSSIEKGLQLRGLTPISDSLLRH
jgi:hypothetical protein